MSRGTAGKKDSVHYCRELVAQPAKNQLNYPEALRPKGALKYGVRELAPAFGCGTPPQAEQAPFGKAAASRRTPYFRAALHFGPCQ
jgi:hypothetical protein